MIERTLVEPRIQPGQPVAQRRDGGRLEGRVALFPSLAEAADVRFAVEMDVAAGQLRELGDAQAGVGERDDERPRVLGRVAAEELELVLVEEPAGASCLWARPFGRVELVDAIPRNPVGKVLRRELRGRPRAD